jgi:hypothetical protein
MLASGEMPVFAGDGRDRYPGIRGVLEQAHGEGAVPTTTGAPRIHE